MSIAVDLAVRTRSSCDREIPTVSLPTTTDVSRLCGAVRSGPSADTLGSHCDVAIAVLTHRPSDLLWLEAGRTERSCVCGIVEQCQGVMLCGLREAVRGRDEVSHLEVRSVAVTL